MWSPAPDPYHVSHQRCKKLKEGDSCNSLNSPENRRKNKALLISVTPLLSENAGTHALKKGSTR